MLVCRRGDEILAGLIVFDHSKWGLTLATPLPLFPFNGPVIRAMDDAGNHKITARTLKYSEAFARFLNKYYNYWIIDTGFGFHDVRSFQWTGCNLEPVFTYRLNLRNREDLSGGYNQTVRKKLKEATNLGITINETAGTGKFTELYERSYRRHAMHPPASKALVEKILGMIIKLPQVKLYIAESENKILAGRVIVEDRQIVYDLLAGSDDLTGLGATYIVHTLLTKYSSTHKQFEFMGAGHPQIEQFKRGFGGNLDIGFRISRKNRFPLSLLINLHNANLIWRRKL